MSGTRSRSRTAPAIDAHAGGAPGVPVQGVTRRRALCLVAAAAGLPLLGLSGASATPNLHHWRGTALGAPASLSIHHADVGEARRLVALALAEIERLEAVFSLYRPNSALVRLNRDGRLDAPPLDLVTLLGHARWWGERTGGAFDVTVQPLWRLFAEHFAAPGADPRGPAQADIEAVRALVDYRAIEIGAARIALARPGMAVTLNGIAQGYMTDRVAALLHTEGLDKVLIDLGEILALGRHPSGGPWRIGLANPSEPGALIDTIDVEDRAVATSAITGTRFDDAGRHHHVFNPRRGRPSGGLLSVSVVARRALDADALSTAVLADAGLLTDALALSPDSIQKIITVDRTGSVRTIRHGAY